MLWQYKAWLMPQDYIQASCSRLTSSYLEIEVILDSHNPYISMVSSLISDSSGSDLASTQDTPVAIYKENAFITFNDDVHIQKPLDSLPAGTKAFVYFFDVR